MPRVTPPTSPSPPSSFNPLMLALFAALWIAALANWPLWQALARLPEMASMRGALFIGGFALGVGALTFAVLALFAWRWTIKPVIALFVVVAAVVAHFTGSYGVVIDPTMMVNVLQTDAKETLDLLSWRLFASLAVLAALPLWWLWRTPLAALPAWRQVLRNGLALVGALIVVVAIVMALFADMSATMRNHKSLRYLINPLNAFFSLGAVATHAGAKPAGPPLPIGHDAVVLPRPDGAKPPLLLLIVGETARADHFSLNGYTRPTNAELARLPVLSFRNVSACGTSTAASLPCMFSHLGRKGFESRDHDHENLLDLLQRAGLAVLWLDNQAGCKGLCDRVPSAMAHDAAGGDRALLAGVCDAQECLDEALLRGLERRLAALAPERRAKGVVLVLHQMGSHGPAYHKRSPPDRKPFQPECTTNALQQCDPAGLVNAYDNSIAYTDHVLAQSIAWLQGQSDGYEPSLLYVSDHGESLGENNLYLHGLPYAVAPREQTHVPMLMWLGAVDGWRGACLQDLLDAPLSHDHLFHTVLGMAGVMASEYKPALDALATCRVVH
ncbi:MAG TPA: phosphoethanolamine--lipid A transferase [Albitalea sp.]|uniref:phosphoethanolamine transferase n=1 Tax=Piscinibacter sp. TaxID=1903157 RepID=UPI002ED42E43